MKSLLVKFFIDNWKRKSVAVILSIFIWFQVNQQLITTKSIANVPIRVINIPAEKTVMNLQSNSGMLTKRAQLTMTGNKNVLDELNSSDLEIVIDAHGHEDDWRVEISRRNLISLNPNVDINKGITRVTSPPLFIQMTKLVTEKIPIYITQPIGEAPKGYQYLDVWPYQLSLNVSGPEEAVKRYKTRGVRLTFDLNNITKAELDALRHRPDSPQGDEVTFFVPDQWKRVTIPLLSDTPIEIDDPKAKDLRIDFIRVSSIPIKARIPLSLYFPTETLSEYNPEKITWGKSPLIETYNGLQIFSQSLFAKGVSQRFVRVVEQFIQLSITVDPIKENQSLNWSIEFINPRLLEDRYVSLSMSDVSDEEIRELSPLVREEVLRNRFRSYMNRFQLYKQDEKRLELNVKLENAKVVVEEGSASLYNTNYFMKE